MKRHTIDARYSLALPPVDAFPLFPDLLGLKHASLEDMIRQFQS